MSDIGDKIREIAKNLLEEGKVKYFIGYAKGSDSFRARPIIIDDPKDVDKLIWSPTCVNNLAVYLIDELKKKPKRGEEPDTRPVGIIVKACDARGITVLLQENILPRERAYIIGIPCTGMADPAKLEVRVREKGISHETAYEMNIKEEEGTFVGEAKGEEETFSREEVLLDKCRECLDHNPKECDIVIGEKVENPAIDKYAIIKELAEMPLEDKEKFWDKMFERCIRCYACKEVCPICYCEECTVEKAKPMRWCSKAVDKSNNAFFHLLRAMHLVGRCIDCGECERVCPMGIPLRKLYRKLAKDAEELYGYEAGLGSEDIPLFATFKIEDPDEFE